MTDDYWASLHDADVQGARELRERLRHDWSLGWSIWRYLSWWLIVFLGMAAGMLIAASGVLP